MTRRGFLGLLGKALAVGAVAAAVPEILEASAPSADAPLSGIACPNAIGVQGVEGPEGPEGPEGIFCPGAAGNPGVTGCTGLDGPTGSHGGMDCESWRRELEKQGIPTTWRGQRILCEHEINEAIFPYGPEPE